MFSVASLRIPALICCSLLFLLCACDQKAPSAAKPAAPSAQNASAAASPDAQAAPKAASDTAPASVISKDSLTHRRFALTRANDQSFPDTKTAPSLEFSEGFRISGAVCNRFTAQAELEGGVLRASRAAATKMMCMDKNLSGLEDDFFKLLQEGVALEMNGDRLVLRGRVDGKDMVLEYVKADLM
jgi:heat shock protein HslJ